MSNSKHRNNHKEKLNNYKKQNKQKMENTQQMPTLPPVQSRPTWNPDANIEVKGFEWEAIVNAMNGMNIGLQAGQSIMSRNILSGTISMDFEKLNPQTMQYEEMSAEEKAPYLEASENDIKAFRERQNAPAQDDGVQGEEQQKVTLLTAEGEPVKKEAKVVNLKN